MTWSFPCRILRVIDGDTVDVVCDLGFGVTSHQRIRLLAVNTPELKGASRVAGLAAKTFVEGWVQALSAAAADRDWPFRIWTEKSDSFGRYLGTIIGCATGETLNDLLLQSGHAVRYRP